MKTTPARYGTRPGRARANERRIISLYSAEFGLAPIARQSAGGGGAWTSANDPLALPFRLNERIVATRLGWWNGGTITTSNFDLGIYDSAFNRLVSCGSTARAGGGLWQWVDIADTALDPGNYYLVGAGDTTGASRVQGVSIATPGLAFLGAQDSATDAFPLPNPLTNMAAAATITILPYVGIECTTTVPAPSGFQRLPAVWMPENLYDAPSSTIASAGSFTNTAANEAVYLPVIFPADATIYSLSFAATNGTGNYDIGLYDAAFRLLTSSGSTAMSAAGVKTHTFPDMHYHAGDVIYIGAAWSNTSARFLCHSFGSLPQIIQLGCAEETSALPLPSTATPTTPTAMTNTPLFAFGVR